MDSCVVADQIHEMVTTLPDLKDVTTTWRLMVRYRELGRSGLSVSEIGEGDFRSRYFRDDRPEQFEQRVAAIVADLGIAPDEIAENALRFVLSSPALSTVIPGMRTVRNVERNTAVSDGRPLTADQLAALAEHRWQRNFYA